MSGEVPGTLCKLGKQRTTRFSTHGLSRRAQRMRFSMLQDSWRAAGAGEHRARTHHGLNDSQHPATHAHELGRDVGVGASAIRHCMPEGPGDTEIVWQGAVEQASPTSWP